MVTGKDVIDARTAYIKADMVRRKTEDEFNLATQKLKNAKTKFDEVLTEFDKQVQNE